MRARSQILRHPQGMQLRTPLLIPSFSSRGFDVARRSPRSKKLISECSQYLEVFAGRLDKAFLVSAYDLKHELLEAAPKLRSSFVDSVWSHPRVLFIDSGAYECRDGTDSHEPLQEMRVPFPWTEDEFKRFADKKLPTSAPIALVNWDLYKPYPRQIDAAQEFFHSHKKFMSVLLLKPEAEGGLHDIARLAPVAGRLAAFDVIGVTEKELGDSIVERMANVARLRDLLDSANVAQPIHLFGALDPLYTPLYFASGAEIFDGLSWLRYLWIEGIAGHRSSLPVLAGHQRKGYQEAVEIALAQSLDTIEQLELRLKNFIDEGGDWTVFREQRVSVLEDAFLDMEATL